MNGDLPKQYLPLLGRPMLYHTLHALSAVKEIRRIFVVLAPDDPFWERYDWQEFGERLLPLRCGGGSRAESVTNGLHWLANQIQEEDWILVHDAARCCVRHEHLRRLIQQVAEDPVGGLLAIRVADTLKREDLSADGVARVGETVPREGLWQAQTPQMFRYGVLRRALEANPEVTDEAGAIERLGLHPRIVEADATNLKVTYPNDLDLAAVILSARRR